MNSFKGIEHKNVKILKFGIRSKGNHFENLNLYACPLFSLPLLPENSPKSHKFRFFKDKLIYSYLDIFPF